MAKAVVIDHAFILSDGVMFRLGRGVLKVRQKTPVPTLQTEKKSEDKKSKN